LERFRELLAVPCKIVVVSHSNPDGDAVGSALATDMLLKKMGHQVSTILPNSFPDFLAWLPGSQSILIYDKDGDAVRSTLEACDLIICVDFNAPGRVAAMETVLLNARAKKVLIDHHLEPEPSFDLIVSVINVSSTSELLYHLFDALGFSGLFDKAISECLYTGIMTDTGSFSYACSYVPTFLVAAQLLRQGIDPEKIHRLVYDTYSESRMRLIGHCLSDRLVVLPDYGTAYIYLSVADLVQYDYQVGDTEGLVNYALAIKGVQFAAFFY
jgi:bifunctional oligoribonuclease and PAP phosphatase NrnA